MRIPLLSDEAPPVSLATGLVDVWHQRLSLERASTRILPLATQFRSSEEPRRKSQRVVLRSPRKGGSRESARLPGRSARRPLSLGGRRVYRELVA